MQFETANPRHGKAKFLIPKHYNTEDWENTILEKKIYTIEDYNQLPEGAPYQLIGGKLVMTPAPEVYHQDISRNVEIILYNFIMNDNLGKVYHAPIDVKLSEIDVCQPDIIFICKERLSIIGKKRIEGSPDIVIEILSPSTAYYDLREKYNKYAESNVKEYWIIDPNMKKVEIFINKSGKFELHNEAEGTGIISSIILKGLEVSLSDIF